MKALKGGWKEIPILSGSDSNTLLTPVEIKENEELVLFDGTNYIRNNVGSVTQQGTPWDISDLFIGDSLSLDINITTDEVVGIFVSDNYQKLFVTTSESDYPVYVFDVDFKNSAKIKRLIGRFTFTEPSEYLSNIWLSDDGYILILLTNGRIYKYTLTNPFDLSSRTYEASLDVEGYPHHLYFSKDGLTLFLLGIDNTIRKYVLSNPYDIGSITSPAQVYTFPEGNSTSYHSGLLFSGDGSKLITIQTQNKVLQEFSLGTPFDLTTINSTPDIEKGISSIIETNYYSISSVDGKSIYFIDPIKLTLLYNVVNSIDISSFSLSTTPTKAFKQYFPAVWVSIPFEQEETDNDWYQYQVTVTEKLKEIKVLSGSDSTTLKTVDEVVTGEKVVLYNNVDGVKEGEIGSVILNNDNISSAQYDTSFELPTIASYPTGLFFKPDGSVMYVVGDSDNNVTSYNLSTPWDISTASYSSSFSVSSQDSFPGEIFFKPDGTRMFIVGSDHAAIYQYNLSTPWDITTASYSGEVSLGAQVSNPNRLYGLFFSPDGLKMFVTTSIERKVYQYNLSTPWDITTASYSNISYLSNRSTYGLFFSPDGTRMFIAETIDTNYQISQYNLSTPWDISTASYSDGFSLSYSPSSLFFNLTGTRLFVSRSGSSRKIYQYNFPNSVYSYHQADISSFNLTNPPQKAWKEPTKVYIAMESNPDRCLYFDEDISDKIQKATTNSFELTDDLSNILEVGDELIVNKKQTTITDFQLKVEKFVKGSFKESSKAILVNDKYYLFSFDSDYNLYISTFDKKLNLLGSRKISKSYLGLGAYLRNIHESNGKIYLIFPYGLLVYSTETGSVFKQSLSSSYNINASAKYDKYLYLVSIESNKLYVWKYDTTSNSIADSLKFDLTSVSGFADFGIVPGDLVFESNKLFLAGRGDSGSNGVIGYIDFNNRRLRLVKKYDTGVNDNFRINYGSFAIGYLAYDNTKNIHLTFVGKASVRYSYNALVPTGYSAFDGTNVYITFGFSDGSVHKSGIARINVNDPRNDFDFCLLDEDYGLNKIELISGKLIISARDGVLVLDKLLTNPNLNHFTPTILDYNVTTVNSPTIEPTNVSNPLSDLTSISSVNTELTYETLFESILNYVEVPEQSSTITSVIIPQRTEPQTLQYRTYLSDQDVIKSRYQAVNKKGRALRIKLEGIEDTYVNNFKIDLWTGE